MTDRANAHSGSRSPCGRLEMANDRDSVCAGLLDCRAHQVRWHVRIYFDKIHPDPSLPGNFLAHLVLGVHGDINGMVKRSRVENSSRS